MSITYTWVIGQMDCRPQAEGQTDVVFNIHWRVNATDGTYNATNYGAIGVPYKADEPYTPYTDLTQSQVIGWVQAALGAERVANIETGLANDIANQMNPPVISPALPWAT